MKKEPNHIPDLLFHSAKGFYDIGFNCAYHLNQNNDISGFQRIAAGAVNLSFAAELFLKGIHLITSKESIKGHKLEILFENLPQKVKNRIEELYKYQLDHNKEMELLPSMKIVLTRSQSNSSDNSEFDEKKDLKEFLKSHNQTFENWRYLYEYQENGYSYDINYKLMDCFIKSLIEFINETPRNPSLHLFKDQKNSS